MMVNTVTIMIMMMITNYDVNKELSDNYVATGGNHWDDDNDDDDDHRHHHYHHDDDGDNDKWI